ncbi:MAG: riboflavin synthase [Bacteroidia bacterium]|nr:riboflavin synthase [Bacteroidia bacterium]
MFTGIVECIGEVISVDNDRTNKTIGIKSEISNQLKVDQSVSHNGICLTVIKVDGDIHYVTAISETIQKTDIEYWEKGIKINLERSMQMNGRFDGHIVQGHIDITGVCSLFEDKNGSIKIVIKYDSSNENRTIEKGSITINGISLTVVESKLGEFSVEIIPYTLNNTNLMNLKVGNIVNLEFDIIGKWVKEWMKK